MHSEGLMSRMLLLAVLCLSSLQLRAAETLIYAARLIDGRAPKPASDVTLVVADGRISRIVPGFMAPQDGQRVVDLRKYTVVPGLMDMHTHLMSQHSKEAYTEKFFMEDSEYALRSTVYARLTLLAGFTTVR
ncbi:MAG TPA: amidohydrolase, partial [Planctomycetaceae bacterium]|nr:amidohydrolase [Planctomycetaceae bacterium]